MVKNNGHRGNKFNVVDFISVDHPTFWIFWMLKNTSTQLSAGETQQLNQSASTWKEVSPPQRLCVDLQYCASSN